MGLGFSLRGPSGALVTSCSAIGCWAGSGLAPVYPSCTSTISVSRKAHAFRATISTERADVISLGIPRYLERHMGAYLFSSYLFFPLSTSFLYRVLGSSLSVPRYLYVLYVLLYVSIDIPRAIYRVL